MHYSKILPLVFLALLKARLLHCTSTKALCKAFFRFLFSCLSQISEGIRVSNPKGKRPCLLPKKNLICLLVLAMLAFLLYMWQQQQKSKLRHKLTSYVSRLRIVYARTVFKNRPEKSHHFFYSPNFTIFDNYLKTKCRI